MKTRDLIKKIYFLFHFVETLDLVQDHLNEFWCLDLNFSIVVHRNRVDSLCFGSFSV